MGFNDGGYRTPSTKTRFKGMNIRYIRDYQSGSSLDNNIVLSQIKAYDFTSNNKALNKNVTCLLPAVDGYPLSNAVDNSLSSYFIALQSNPDLQYITVDLGEVLPITIIFISRYPGRTFHNTKLQVSEDGSNWVTLFDSISDGEYLELVNGRYYAVLEPVNDD